MALGKIHVPELDAVLGPSQRDRGYQLTPGVSDYVTGGYPILASDVGMVAVFGAWIIAMNAAAEIFQPAFILAAGAFGSAPSPQSTIYLRVLEVVSSSGSYYEFGEVANGYNLTGFQYFGVFRGY